MPPSSSNPLEIICKVITICAPVNFLRIRSWEFHHIFKGAKNLYKCVAQVVDVEIKMVERDGNVANGSKSIWFLLAGMRRLQWLDAELFIGLLVIILLPDEQYNKNKSQRILLHIQTRINKQDLRSLGRMCHLPKGKGRGRNG